MRDYKIKYRTFDQLLDSVMDDFQTYDKNSLVEPSQLIKVAKKINKQLNHRITKTKQCIIEYDNYVAKLPDDFYTPNFIIYIKPYNYTNPVPQGTHTENISIEAEDLDKLNPNQEIYITDNGHAYDIIQRKSYVNYYFKAVSRVKLLNYEDLFKTNYADVTGNLVDEHIRLNHKSGYLYFNYEGMLEDEEGNLLVIDHDLANDYYEYSLKRRIVENLFFNGEEATVTNKLNLLEQRYKESKREALSAANMFDYGEMEETLDINRKAAFKRYYSIFSHV